MGNINYTRVILGSLRFKSSPNTDLSLQVPFKNTQRELIEYERSSDVNLQQVFQDERQKSNFLRPSCKFQVIFRNSYFLVLQDIHPSKEIYIIQMLKQLFHKIVVVQIIYLGVVSLYITNLTL